MSGRVLPVVGLAAAGGVGYYLYSAGGDPKLAEKKAEHDAANAVRRVKGDFPGQDKEAKKAGEEGYEAVRSTAQQYANQARTEAQKAEQKLDQYSVEARKKYEEAKVQAERELNSTRREVNSAVDKFDKQAIEATRETKSWFGSWFK
ncbi:hypothetical protein BDU57DRAFT_490777 [Ampelomyces quisqualis]|uniref:Uncharacterized protein n=1 Tax=Ampelomyces quisqualis TaxID=50730 RepID=A0A6A5QWH0_AMPQU|nr:hypothetical protein BDU57DRAFT_490777 [Ampelomyces quisqualis]